MVFLSYHLCGYAGYQAHLSLPAQPGAELGDDHPQEGTLVVFLSYLNDLRCACRA